MSLNLRKQKWINGTAIKYRGLPTRPVADQQQRLIISVSIAL
jgi:hypothetical protein